MRNNRATIYSNGIADFQRVFPVNGETKNRISIPVRQQHLGDVLASLTISGDVRIEAPPSYQPANQDDGNIHISTNNALIDLAMQLTGAQVEIKTANAVARGVLVGIHEQQVASAGEPVVEKSVVIQSEAGISRVSIGQIESMNFLEESIRSEINKALSRRLRSIKPNSTFVDFELSTDQPTTEAVIQYAIPAAAWKISYRILIDAAGSIEFHGHAIVDNNTDEDWNDFIISVVMGQPITFTTDLADCKTPRRSHVNIVQDSALGAVEVEEAYDVYDESPLAGAGPSSNQFFETRQMRSVKSAAPRGKSAEVSSAEITETGDSCIFESATPVSIAAHRSAVIPMFVASLDESNPVLHFKTENHEERPFRALRFRNTTAHSLGRGVCTVYDGTTYAGNCILPATKPGADALLPHALETAVSVWVENERVEQRQIGIRISKGVVYHSCHQRATTRYHVKSQRPEAFNFLLDHDNRLADTEYVVRLKRDEGEDVSLECESLKIGKRVQFELFANEGVVVEVEESTVLQTQLALVRSVYSEGDFQVGWLYDHIVKSNFPFAKDPAVANCVALKERVSETEDEILKINAEIERLNQRQDRLRKNVSAGGVEQQNARWVADLAAAEDEIVKLEETRLPNSRTDLEQTQKKLFDAIKALAFEWNESAG